MPDGGGPIAALSGRENIAVIADEAHRSQCGFGGGCLFEEARQSLQGAGGFHRRGEGRQGRLGIHGSQDERLPRGRDGGH